MLQKFQTLTKSFLYTSLFVVLVSLIASFKVVVAAFSGSHLHVQLILTGILALVILPISVFVIFAWIYVIYYYIFDVLLAHQKIIKLPGSTLNNVSNDTLSQSLEQRYNAQPATTRLKSIALTQSDKQFKTFDLGFTFRSRQIRFIGLKNSYLIRFQIDQPTLPTLIINSHLNNDTNGAIDTSQMSVKSVDLGSDFGKNFSLSFIEGNAVDALQIVDPTLMLALLENYTAYDIVVSQNYIDFKFAHIANVKEADGILASSSHLVDIIIKEANKKTNTAIDVLVSIKKSCTTINCVLDELVWQIVKNFGMFIVVGYVFGVVVTIAPNTKILDYVFLIVVLYFMLRTVLALAILSHTFFINAVATSIIKAIISQRARRARKNYQQIRAAYVS